MRGPAIGLGLLSAVVLACPPVAAAQTRPSKVVPQDRPDQAAKAAPTHGAAPPPATPSRPAAAPGSVTPFVLTAVEVVGSSLPADDLAAAWRPLVGQTFNADNLVKITDAIAKAYDRHDVAIYTVIVEAQDFKAGRVRVRALEGRIEATEIVGPDNPRLKALLEQYLNRLAAEQPLRRTTMQRQISLLRDIPGLGAEVTLENGAGDAGVRMKLTVMPRPVQLGLAVNNRGTALLGRTQVAADLYLNGLVRPGDQTRLTAAAPTDGDLFRSYSVQHTQLLGSEGLSITASASQLRTRPKGTDLRGRARSAGVQLSYPLIRSYDRDLYLSVGLDGVDNRNAFLGFTFANDRSRAVRAALAYSAQSETRAAFASVAASQGLDGLGARTTQPGVSEPDFRKLNLRAGSNFALGSRTALRLNGAAQVSSDRLPATELFSLGGDEFGRRFPASIIAGDRGIAGSAELAFAPDRLPAVVQGSETYAFIDGGKVWYRSRLGFPEAKAQLASAGLGVRATISKRVLVQLEGARALDNPAAGFVRGGWRGFFSVRSIF